MTRYNNWSQKAVDKIIEKFSDSEEYVCAAGISPSGKVYIGNLRDLITSDMVCRVLRDNGKKARSLYQPCLFPPLLNALCLIQRLV